MKTFELRWQTRDGLDIFARGWEPEQAPKAVVCLVHGLGEHSGRYAHVAEALGKAGYALFGFDLRGHGRSGGLRGHAPSLEAYLQDIDQSIEQARARYPASPMFLYGHSLGGILALNYVLRRKPEFNGVIVTAPAMHSGLEEQPAKVLLAKILGVLLPNAAVSTGLDPYTISHDPNVVQAYIHDPLVHYKATLGWGRMMLAVNRWTLEHAVEFQLPLLLMQGKEDVIAFPSSSLEFAAPLKDRCTLVLWEGMFHEIHNEPGKNEVFNTMIEWMDTHL
jgi:acylglycerol lipase